MTPATSKAPRAGAATRRRRAAESDWATAPVALLKGYAERGAFRSFTVSPSRGKRAGFILRWHRERNFEFIVDATSKTVRVTEVLPNVPARSSMDRAYRRFLSEFQSDELPPHRRIDPKKASVRCVNRQGSLGVALHVRDGDYAYATRKLLAIVDESYLLFLTLNDYSDYMVQNLDANPDWGK